MKVVSIICVLLWSATAIRAVGQACLTDADRSHGKSTVEQILTDRPDLAAIVKSNALLSTWLEEQFAGSAVGDRLYWDSCPPRAQFADYLQPTEQSRGFVRASADTQLSGLDRCTMLIYGLCNVSRWQERNLLVQEAIRGRIDRDMFIARYVRLDYEDKLTTKRLLQRFQLAKQVSDKTPYTSEVLAYEEDFDLYHAKVIAGQRNPLNPMAAIALYYDTVIVPTMKRAIAPSPRR